MPETSPADTSHVIPDLRLACLARLAESKRDPGSRIFPYQSLDSGSQAGMTCGQEGIKNPFAALKRRVQGLSADPYVALGESTVGRQALGSVFSLYSPGHSTDI
jgi:hypothetical protein